MLGKKSDLRNLEAVTTDPPRCRGYLRVLPLTDRSYSVHRGAAQVPRRTNDEQRGHLIGSLIF